MKRSLVLAAFLLCSLVANGGRAATIHVSPTGTGSG
jgi:hypothetical protein